MGVKRNKPSQADLARGGFNPVPAEREADKDQFGPLPTDDPDEAKRDEAKQKRKRAEKKSDRAGHDH